MSTTPRTHDQQKPRSPWSGPASRWATCGLLTACGLFAPPAWAADPANTPAFSLGDGLGFVPLGLDNERQQLFLLKGIVGRTRQEIHPFVMTNFSKPKPVGPKGRTAASQMAALVIDCERDRMRVTQTTWFRGPMGEGEVVYENKTPAVWTPVKVDSVPASLRDGLCDRRLKD